MGSEADQHALGRTLDDEPLNSGHLATDAQWFMRRLRDSPMNFQDRDRGKLPSFPLRSRVHLVHDALVTHRWMSGERIGRWDWMAEVPEAPVGAPPPPPTGGPPPPTTPGEPMKPRGGTPQITPGGGGGNKGGGGTTGGGAPGGGGGGAPGAGGGGGSSGPADAAPVITPTEKDRGGTPTAGSDGGNVPETPEHPGAPTPIEPDPEPFFPRDPFYPFGHYDDPPGGGIMPYPFDEPDRPRPGGSGSGKGGSPAASTPQNPSGAGSTGGTGFILPSDPTPEELERLRAAELYGSPIPVKNGTARVPSYIIWRGRIYWWDPATATYRSAKRYARRYTKSSSERQK